MTCAVHHLEGILQTASERFCRWNVPHTSWASFRCSDVLSSRISAVCTISIFEQNTANNYLINQFWETFAANDLLPESLLLKWQIISLFYWPNCVTHDYQQTLKKICVGLEYIWNQLCIKSLQYKLHIWSAFVLTNRLMDAFYWSD